MGRDELISRPKAWPTGFHPNHCARASSSHSQLRSCHLAVPSLAVPGYTETAPGGCQAPGWLPPSLFPAEGQDSPHLTRSTTTLGPRSGGHALRQTGLSATEGHPTRRWSALGCAPHAAAPYVWAICPTQAHRESELAMTERKEPILARAHNRSKRAGRACQKSLGAPAQRHPSPLPVPAGPGSPPLPAAVP